MKMVHKTKVLSGSYLKQNLYRHDGLLAAPKGYMINRREKKIIDYYDYEFVLIEDKRNSIDENNKVNEILNIIEHVLMNNHLWDYSFGEKMYDKFAEVVMKNRNRVKYLAKFSELNAYYLSHYINTAIIVTSIITENKEENINSKIAEILFLTLMHDAAKVDAMKEGKNSGIMSKEEYEKIKRMPEETAKIVLSMGFNPYEIKFVYEIDERWDGHGYGRVKGEEIEELAQIISLAKKYDEMSSFNKEEEKEKQLKIYRSIKEDINRIYSARIVGLFFERFSPYKLGQSIELSNGEKGEVMVFRSEAKFLPMIECFDDQGEKTRVIDLSQQEEIEIKKIEEYI